MSVTNPIATGRPATTGASFTAPLWLSLLITAVVAFLIGQFALMWRRHRRRKARRA